MPASLVADDIQIERKKRHEEDHGWAIRVH
jgi:hypothetical protein